nr:UPF0481 protein At3g47200-like [Ipomoea batatas]
MARRTSWIILVTQLTKASLANLCYEAKNFNTLQSNHFVELVHTTYDFLSIKSNQMPNKPWQKILCCVKGCSEVCMAKDTMIEDMEGATYLQDLANCEQLRILSEKLRNVKQLSSESCIFKVNERLRKTNPEAYTPLTISIGPYHHGKPEFRKMERLKELYTQSLLERARVGVEVC